MRRLAAFVIVVFIALAFLNFTNARASKIESFAWRSSAKQAERDESFWVGEYSFVEDGGRTAGGTRIIVIHSLAIHKEAGTLIAEISSQGYQTSRQVVGEVKVTGNVARIYFKSYGEGNMYEPHREGDLLLTFKRVAQRGRIRILTYWNTFELSMKPLVNGRVYFKRGQV
jgi:hypothetical protein